MLTVTALPAFTDNYIWLVDNAEYAVAVDPGDARPVLEALAAARLKLAAILITHHHFDHCGGVAGIAATHRVPVFGPRAEAPKIRGLTQLLDDGDRVEIAELGLACEVLSIPGHTLGHIAYLSARSAAGDPPRLFCGDTLFSAGCGRLFEGTAAQMQHSLQRLNSFAADTEVYCMHEYTLANLAFAAAVEPHNRQIGEYRASAQARRSRGEPSLPSTLGLERSVNPFLRVGEPAIMAAARSQAGHSAENPVDPVSVFATLRRWKDQFRAA